MSLNSSSSSSNDSLLHSNHSSNNSDIPHDMDLSIIRRSTLIFSAYCITDILLLLPLCILVFYVGLQRRRPQRSNSSAATSHSDIFTYHMVTMELFSFVGCIICCWCIYRNRFYIFYAGLYFFTFIWYGETLFHLLTCVERYLAVVHPITYLSLRGERGIRIRNISIGCVWLLSFVGTSVMTSESVSPIMNICLLVFSNIVIVFCSISVLCVLIRPKPGEQGKVDQSKLKAFYTIVAILGVLLVRLVWSFIEVALTEFYTKNCFAIALAGTWFNLPCSPVLPLLFLHRAGIFACHTTNTE